MFSAQMFIGIFGMVVIIGIIGWAFEEILILAKRIFKKK